MIAAEANAVRLRDLFAPRTAVDTRVPLESVPFAVLDTELTGLDPKRDSVLSVGVVKMWGTRIEMGRTYYRLFRPASAMGRAGILVHGITPGEAAAAIPIGAAGAEIAEFCGDRIVAGHFLAIDLGFLGREIAAFAPPAAARRAVDTLSIHRWIHAERCRHGGPCPLPEGDYNLFTLARRRGIPVTGAHNALRDAFITAQLLQRLLRELPALGVRTLGDLLHIGKP